MASYHNNRLTMVGLYDSDESYNTPSGMLPQTISGYSGLTSAEVYYNNPEPAPQVQYDLGSRPLEPEHFIGDLQSDQDQEQEDEDFRMADSASEMRDTPPHDSDYYGSSPEDPTPAKTTKINKDGAPRKTRKPRPKLLKWNDIDWKKGLLGIVWACGENDIQIPFDQAAKLVGENCTASAFQQAILKLRAKQIEEGYQIPVLKMAWTRKNRNKASSPDIAKAKSTQARTPPKAPNQKRKPKKAKRSLIVKLKIGRRGMENMQAENTQLLMNKPSSGISTQASSTLSHHTHHQEQLLAVQQPMEWTTESEKHSMHCMPGLATTQPMEWSVKPEEHNMDCMPSMTTTQPRDYGKLEVPAHETYGAGQYAQMGYGFDAGSFQKMVVQQSTLPEQCGVYNHNHSIMGNFSLEGDNYAMGTTDDLLSFQGIATSEGNSFGGGYFPGPPNQATTICNNPYELCANYNQEHISFGFDRQGMAEFPELTDYEAYAIGDNNQVPLDDVFKTESPDMQSFDLHFFT